MVTSIRSFLFRTSFRSAPITPTTPTMSPYQLLHTALNITLTAPIRETSPYCSRTLHPLHYTNYTTYTNYTNFTALH